MPEIELKRAAGVAYREALPTATPASRPVVCIHGFPETSYMWRGVMAAAAEAGHRVLAPDLPGSGDSPADPPSTWERLVESLERFVADLALEPVVLVVHDWGGLIGLRWACDHPDRVAAMVISDTSFFADGKWSGMAEGLRTPGTGEQMLEGLDRASFGQLMAASSDGLDEASIDEYWRSLRAPGSSSSRAPATSSMPTLRHAARSRSTSSSPRSGVAVPGSRHRASGCIRPGAARRRSCKPAPCR